jgi:hypothetical protein
MAMARMLKEQRSGRAAKLPQNICIRENGPLVLSFMKEFRLLTLTSANSGSQNPRKNNFHSPAARLSRSRNKKIFLWC